MLRTPQFYMLYAAFVMMATGGLLVTANAGPIAQSWGIPAAALAVATSFNALANGGSRIFWGWVSDRTGRELAMGVAFLLQAICLVLVLTVGRLSGTLFTLTLVLTFFTWGEVFSLFPSIVGDYFGTRSATSNYGVMYSAKGVAAIIGGGLAAHVDSVEGALREPRRLERLLNVHAVIDDVGDELGVGLCLIPGAHDAEADTKVALLHEPRDDRVQRTLARCQHVRVVFVEREERAAILQREAGASRHQPAAEPLVDALNERHDVAVAIDCGKIDRVAAVARGDRIDRDRLGSHGRRVRPDQPRARFRSLLVHERRHRDAPELRIGGVPQHVRVGALLGLDHHVQRCGGREAVVAQRELLHQVEHDQRGDALRVGWNFVDAPSMIGRRNGIDPLGLEVPQIFGSHRPAVGARAFEDCGG